MRFLLLLLLTFLPPAATSGACGSIVPSVCAQPVDGAIPGRKVLKVQPTLTAFHIGDRFPVETRSLLLDPARYSLPPSDGTWRYYAMEGVVYRVDTSSALVLEVIRTRRTAHLR